MHEEDGATLHLWPELSLWDRNRIVWGRWTQRMPEVLASLTEEGKPRLTLEEAHQLADSIGVVSKRVGFYIYDSHPYPEPFCPPELPACVLATNAATYYDPYRPQLIVDTFFGRCLPENMPEAQFYRHLDLLRRKLVFSGPCKRAGCKTRVVITVATAAQAIIGNQLIERGLPYELPTLCQRCREARDEDLLRRRPAEVTEQKEKGHRASRRTLATVQLGETPKGFVLREFNLNQEGTDGNHGPVATAAVAVAVAKPMAEA